MTIRSFLFVPGDSERKLAKGQGSGADALILDLEDAVAPARKLAARGLVAEALAARPPTGPELWVRVNPLDEGGLDDLAQVVRPGLDGIVLPKIDGVAEVVRLSHHLEVLERRDGLAPGSVRILPVATETAAAPFGLAAFTSLELPRLYGLTWGAEDLATALGASTNRDEAGGFAFTYRVVRSLALMAARAAGAEPVDTLYADFRDGEGLARDSAASAREGFTGRLAIHPDQVATINAAFSPSEAEVAQARRVVEAFAAAPDAGAVGLDGHMLDRPHLKQAERILDRHARRS
ncbi:MAG: CoA ester lyase [Methylobacteriaceae bacterium]|nr:CoA ester lyase [Methylobacteriaceae bacterium]